MQMNKSYIVYAIILGATSWCAYYKLYSQQVIIPSIVDALKRQNQIEVITSLQECNSTFLYEEEEEHSEQIIPLKLDQKLLKILKNNDDTEFIYNMCEFITLLNNYLSDNNLITNQTVTLNDNLSTLFDGKQTTIDYNSFVSLLLSKYTTRY